MTTETTIYQDPILWEGKTWEQMNAKHRKGFRLNKHYNSLEHINNLCGGGKLTGKQLSLKLFKLEQEAHKITTDECNGDNTPEQDTRLEQIKEEVQALFNGNLQGFFINGDARGYALKIKDKVMREVYTDSRLYQDWGGYGILSPEINGNK